MNISSGLAALAAQAAFALPLFAQAAAKPAPVIPVQPGTAAEAAQKTLTAWDLIQSGGIFLWPLVVMSVFTLLLILFFFFTIRRGGIATSGFLQTIDARLRKRDYLGLLSDANRHSESLARVVQRTLDFSTKNTGASLEAIREIAESEGSRQAAALNQRVSYLADLGAIAPMIGLLGTVAGMIKSFSALGADVAASKPLMLASGVSEALVCTAAGLLVGIMAFSAFAYFRTKAGRLTAELEAVTTQFFAQFSISHQGPSSSGGRAPVRRELMMEEF